MQHEARATAKLNAGSVLESWFTFMSHSTTVYLIHFARPIGNPDNPHGSAQHYLGSAHDLAARLEAHRTGYGAKIMAAVTRAGIPWLCVRQWECDSRELEMALKRRKNAPRELCPICMGKQPPPCERVLGRRVPMTERPVVR